MQTNEQWLVNKWQNAANFGPHYGQQPAGTRGKIALSQWARQASPNLIGVVYNY